ncbi:MAG: hypothetical protein KDA47_20330 [Planctomycetales bacterium]|nr:hypothetical protein [Planctomycetales bacterium]
MMRTLWNDESGAVISGEVVLTATILVIGVVVGLKSVRDAVVTEICDLAQAVSNLSQSYSYSGVDGHSSGAAGAFFQDAGDFCDTAETDVGRTDSKCVNVCAASGIESGVLP